MWSTLVLALSVLGAVNAASVQEAIVYPKVVAARDGSGAHEVTFSAMGLNFALNLKPSAPVFTEEFLHIYADDSGQMVKEWVDTKEIQSHLFQDPTTGAAVHLSNDGLHPIMAGLLSDEYRIMPADFHPRSALEPIPHKVYKVNLALGDKRALDFLVPPVNFSKTADPSYEGTERQNNDMVAETLLTMDYKLTSTLEQHGIDRVHYASIFMNGVQCKFNQMSNPNVITKLALVVANRYTSWEPYIENNRQGEKVQGNKALDGYRDYMNNWQRNDKNLKFDAAYLLTGRDMYSGDDPNANGGLAGLAWVSAVCGSYKYGMGEDQPLAYGGVFTAAHEFGHSFGCPHDGDGKPGQYGSGHPGSDRCPWEEGYIMSYIDGGMRRHMFSSCCKDCMRWFAGRSDSDCTRQHDHQNTRNPWGHYPGNEINMDQYCTNKYRDRYDNVKAHELREHKNEEDKCKMMCCPSGENFCYIDDKLDGHPCGDGLQCENRHCVRR